MNKIISVDFLNELASYLGSKPYVETYQLIAKIMQLEDLKEKEPVAEEVK